MQDNKPKIRENLERVGITNLKTLVTTSWKGKRYKFVPEIELTIDLDKEKRGAHMSRLIESITETIEEEALLMHGSLEELERDILEKLKEKHPYRKGSVYMETDFVVEKETPATKKKTMETHKVGVGVCSENNSYRKKLKAEVVGNTVCPHAMDKTSGKSHIQRAIGVLEIETDYSNEIALEDMIEIVEESFPSAVYTLLKTEDEKHVVNKMFEKPKFVEDVTREILNKARQKFRDCKIKVKTSSEESIHRHDVIAEGSCIT